MSRWLVRMSFGPVQTFIASARRSRDLWAGSRLLSEIVRSSAKVLIAKQATQATNATLVYPTPDTVARGDDDANLSNEILAVIKAPDEQSLHILVAAVQAGGRARLAQISATELKAWQSALKGKDFRDSLWAEQVEHAFQFHAAWVPLAGDEHYPAASSALKRLMAARKHSLIFAPHPLLQDYVGKGLPKSWLDGVNESVLPEERAAAILRFDLGKDEQLDALGCIKRSFGRQETFTALTRLAAHAWLKSIPDEAPELARHYERLVEPGFATRCQGNGDCYADFPYDAGLFFGGALAEAKSRAASEDTKDANALGALHALEAYLGKIPTRPNPYVALLYADGDRMGVFVGSARRQEHHAEISEAIARFSNRVPALAKKSECHAIYHGGDDVMVACVLSEAVACARALAEAFAEDMQAVFTSLQSQGVDMQDTTPPTLRVGIAICHVMEPMNFIRENAKQAEILAKGRAGTVQQGNALGIRLHLRSGPIIETRFGFGEPDREDGDFQRFKRWMKAYAGNERTLPARTAFDIFQIADTVSALQRGLTPADAHSKSSDASDAAGRLMENAQRIGEAEFKRVLQRSRESGGEKEISKDVRDALQHRLFALHERNAGDLVAAMKALGSELLLARWMSATDARQLLERGGEA